MGQINLSQYTVSSFSEIRHKPSHARKGARKYRYYVSRNLQAQHRGATTDRKEGR
jgi:hypothetical protein